MAPKIDPDISVSPDEFDANFAASLSDLFEFGPEALR